MNKLKTLNSQFLLFSSFNLMHRFAVFIYIPFLSIILFENGYTSQEITSLFAVLILAMFLFSPIVGRVSDMIGRKLLLFWGLLFQILILILYYFFIDTLQILYILRFFEGIFFVCVGIVAMGGFEDLIRENRGFWTGVYESLGTIGTILGPIIAGIIASYFFSKVVFILSSIIIVLTLFLLIFLPEKKIKTKNRLTLQDFNPFNKMLHFFRNKKLSGVAILGVTVNSMHELFVIFFPIYILESFNLVEYHLGLLLAIPAIFHIFQVFFGKISDKISSEFGSILGIFLFSFSLFLLPYADSIVQIVILLVFYGIGAGIWNVNALTLMSDIGEKHKSVGEVIGSYAAIVRMVVFFSVIVSAYFIDSLGIALTLQLFAGISLFSILLSYPLLQPIFRHS